MTGLNLRTLFAVMLIALATFAGVSASAQPADPGNRFDVMVADAKATMLVDPGKTIEKAKAAEAAAQPLAGRRRTIAIATAQWLG